MNKAEAISFVRSLLSGGNPVVDTKGKFHQLRVEKAIGIAFSTLIGQAVQNTAISNDYSVLDWYVKAYKDVPVLFDQERNEYYSVPPATVMPLIKLASYRLISPMKDQSFAFAPQSASSVPVFSQLEVSRVISVPSFSVEHNRIWYEKIGPGIDKVLIKAVTKFEDFEDTDEIFLPMGSDSELFMLVQKIMLQEVSTPEDLQNNNAKSPV